MWVADDDGVVSFRDVAPAAGPPPDPPLARLGPALVGRAVRAHPRGRRPSPAARRRPGPAGRPDPPLARAPCGPGRIPVRAGARGHDATERAGRDRPRRVLPSRGGPRSGVGDASRRCATCSTISWRSSDAARPSPRRGARGEAAPTAATGRDGDEPGSAADARRRFRAVVVGRRILVVIVTHLRAVSFGPGPVDRCPVVPERRVRRRVLDPVRRPARSVRRRGAGLTGDHPARTCRWPAGSCRRPTGGRRVVLGLVRAPQRGAHRPIPSRRRRSDGGTARRSRSMPEDIPDLTPIARRHPRRRRRPRRADDRRVGRQRRGRPCCCGRTASRSRPTRRAPVVDPSSAATSASSCSSCRSCGWSSRCSTGSSWPALRRWSVPATSSGRRAAASCSPPRSASTSASSAGLFLLSVAFGYQLDKYELAYSAPRLRHRRELHGPERPVPRVRRPDRAVRAGRRAPGRRRRSPGCSGRWA